MGLIAMLPRFFVLTARDGTYFVRRYSFPALRAANKTYSTDVHTDPEFYDGKTKKCIKACRCRCRNVGNRGRIHCLNQRDYNIIFFVNLFIEKRVETCSIIVVRLLHCLREQKNLNWSIACRTFFPTKETKENERIIRI